MRASLTLLLLSLVALSQTQRAPAQYHIQTDQGPGRFFRFQTESGQFRKEQLNPDGSVTGSFGWVDPNGILRLTDYVSDAGGYRIEKERLFKVGNSAAGGRSAAAPADCQTNPELCFEIYPLDLNSDPTFGRSGAEPGPSGPQQLNIVDGSFRSTGSFLVSSLTSTQDLSNPISKQDQATFFESDIPRPAPAPAPKVVIGAAANEVQPEVRSKPFVIGAAAGTDGFESRARPSAVGSFGGGASEPRSLNVRPSNERSGVVIGLRNNDRKRK